MANISRKIAAIAVCAAVMAFTRPLPCRADANARADFRGSLRHISLSITEEVYSLGKKPGSLDYGLSHRGITIGGPGGTQFYDNRFTTDLDKKSGTHTFSTSLHTKDYGFRLATRFAALRGHTFSVSRGRKTVRTDDYTEYTWSAVCTPCLNFLGQKPVNSNPFTLEWAYRFPNTPWKAGISYLTETINLENPPWNPTATSSRIALNGSRNTPKFDLDMTLARYAVQRTHGNTQLEAKANYKPWKFVNLFVTAGLFTDGVPVSGGAFSDIGEQFIFTYAPADNSPPDTAIVPIFTQKIGYYSFGVRFNLSADMFDGLKKK